MTFRFQSTHKAAMLKKINWRRVVTVFGALFAAWEALPDSVQYTWQGVISILIAGVSGVGVNGERAMTGKAKVPVAGIAAVLALFAAVNLASCAWVQRRADDARDCVVEAGKGLFLDLLPTVRQILADQDWGAVQDKLTDLGKRHGWDFIWCLVARAKSDAMALGSDGSGVNGQVMANADRWLEQ